MDNNTEKILSTRSQLYWNTLLKIPGQVVSFGISIVVARILVPNDYGIMGVAMMLIGYTNLFTDFGFGEAIIQRKIREKRTLNSIFTVNFAVSLLLAALFYLSSGYIAGFFKSPACENVIKVLSAVFVVTSFSAVPSAMLRRDMNFRTLSLINLSSSLLMSLITLLLALKSLGYWALVFGQLIPSLLMTAVLCYKVKWVPGITYDHSAMKGVFNFGVWNFAKTQVGFVAQHTDRFVIGRWLGTASLGFYDKALGIVTMPYDALTMNINGVMFSAFSKNSHDKQQLQQHFKKSLTLLSFINYPIYFGLIVIAPYFVRSLLGEKWAPMIIPMQIILAGGLFKTFSGMTASLNVGVGKYKEHTRRFFVAWVVFMGCCFSLLRLGIVGIALSYLIFNAAQIVLWMNLSLKTIDLLQKDVWNSILPGALASLFMFFITITVSRTLLPQHSFVNMVFLVIIGLFSYCIFVFSDKSELTREFRKLALHDIKKKISTSLTV
jgi:O-antigen/teichoic acid export membrane protein